MEARINLDEVNIKKLTFEDMFVVVDGSTLLHEAQNVIINDSQEGRVDAASRKILDRFYVLACKHFFKVEAKLNLAALSKHKTEARDDYNHTIYWYMLACYQILDEPKITIAEILQDRRGTTLLAEAQNQKHRFYLPYFYALACSAEPDLLGHSILWYAIQCYLSEQEYDALLEQGSDPNEKFFTDEKTKVSAFCTAMTLSNIPAMRSLLKCKRGLSTELINDSFPAHLAAEANNVDCLETLAEFNPDAITVRIKTSKVSALHIAVCGRLEAAASLLKAAPALCNSPNHVGYTPLHVTVANNDKPMTTLLLRYATEVQPVKSNKKAGHSPDTPFQLAVMTNRNGLIPLFFIPSECGYSPFHTAIINRDSVEVTAYLQNGVDIEVKTTKACAQPTHRDLTALQLAREIENNADVVNELLNHHKKNGRTAVQNAVIEGKNALLRKYLAYDPNLALVTRDDGTQFANCTALQLAAITGNNAAVYLLIAPVMNACIEMEKTTSENRLGALQLNFTDLITKLGFKYKPDPDTEEPQLDMYDTSRLNVYLRTYFRVIPYFDNRLRVGTKFNNTGGYTEKLTGNSVSDTVYTTFGRASSMKTKLTAAWLVLVITANQQISNAREAFINSGIFSDLKPLEESGSNLNKAVAELLKYENELEARPAKVRNGKKK